MPTRENAMTANPPRITAFMIVRDEETTLQPCLVSVAGVADELAIIDTGSADGTLQVIQEIAAGDLFEQVQWRERPFDNFGAARQASLDLVQTDWALWIDADEILSELLRRRLQQMKTTGDLNAHQAWRLKRENRILGKVMIGRALNRDWVLRLVRVDVARFSDSYVHEGIHLADDATTGCIAESLYHDTMPAWRPYLRKVDLYTDLDVASSKKRFRPLRLLYGGPAAFIREYFTRTAIIDGWPGFVWSITAAWTEIQLDWKRFKRLWR
jgi:(heptosyl)LPS beta-1,4-glucosyltransferase